MLSMASSARAPRVLPPTPSAVPATSSDEDVEAQVLSEAQLAQRWDLNPKTLERWRGEGHGPRFLKLRGRVRYPIEEVLRYESRSLRCATWSSAQGGQP